MNKFRLFLYLSLLSVISAFSSFANESVKVVFPHKNGFLVLRPDASVYSNNLRLIRSESNVQALGYWKNNDSSVKWKIFSPEGGDYTVEIQWSKGICPMPYTLVISVNGEKSLAWPIESTENWLTPASRYRYNKVLGKITLPKGTSEICLTIPDADKDGSIDLAGLRLMPHEHYQKEVTRLRSLPRLGMSSHELQLLYGPGMRWYLSPFDKRGGESDVDWTIYQGLRPKCTTMVWAMPKMQIKGTFYRDRCIAFDINVWDDKSREIAWPIAEAMIGNQTFLKSNLPKGGSVTAYTEDKNYKFQYWGSYFEVKASGLLKALRAEEETFNSALKIGMTLDQLRQGWGQEFGQFANYMSNYNPNPEDIDWELTESIRPYVSPRRWIMTLHTNRLELVAFFWRDRCIGFDMNYNGGKKPHFSASDCAELTEFVLPGVKFPAFPRTNEFVSYSLTPSKDYKVRKWDREFKFVEVYGSGLIRSMIQQDVPRQKKDSAALTKALYNLPRNTVPSLFGIRSGEIESLLGSPIESELKPSPNSKVWGLPGCNMKLLVTFSDSSPNSLSREISVFYDNGVISADTGLSVAQSLLPANSPLPDISAQMRKRWFSASTKDKRFLIKWHLDKKHGVLLTITDTKVTPKKEESQKMKSLLESL